MASSDPGLENSAQLSLAPVTGWGNASWDLAQVNREFCNGRSRALHFNPCTGDGAQSYRAGNIPGARGSKEIQSLGTDGPEISTQTGWKWVLECAKEGKEGENKGREKSQNTPHVQGTAGVGLGKGQGLGKFSVWDQEGSGICNEESRKEFPYRN